MEFKRFAEILQGLVFRFALTRHINLDTLRDEPFIFLPNARGEFLFHMYLFQSHSVFRMEFMTVDSDCHLRR